MSMNFSPYYGFSIAENSGLDPAGERKLLEKIYDTIKQLNRSGAGIVSDMIFNQLLMVDDCDEFSDFVYAVPAYDIENDKKKFDAMNSGPTSFENVIKNIIDNIKKCSTIDISYLEDYLSYIQNNPPSPKIYSVYI